MVNRIKTVGIVAFMLVMVWVNIIKGQGLNGRRGDQIRCLTLEDKIEILKAHNDYRRGSNSSNMMKMEWNDDLQQLSQLFVDKCQVEHNSLEELTDNFGFRHIGENLYVSPRDYYNVTNAVDAWYSEIENYNYSTGDCEGVCGHYTQTVWHDSYALGCGLIWCAELKSTSQFKSGILLICNYGPSGNIPLLSPYEEGESCSNCSTNCIDKLCSASSTTTPPSDICPARLPMNEGEQVLEDIAFFLFASGVIIIIASLQFFRFSGKSERTTAGNGASSSTA